MNRPHRPRCPRPPRSLLAALLLCFCTAPFAALPRADVRTTGRVLADANGWHATWPGVTLTVRFKGRAIGVVLDDPLSSYTVELDGALRKPLPMVDGEHTVWLRLLSRGVHELRLTRRNETTTGAGTIHGFLLEAGGSWLPAKAADRSNTRQIEFIGDSFTAGLADLSTKRNCNAAKIRATSDATATFGVRVARQFHADWELNAMSGMGMNRNWNGNLPNENFRTYYPRLLQSDAQSVADDPAWHPQLAVIGLGINDFSTPIHDGEAWTRESLAGQFKASYRELIADLRRRYGDIAIIVTAVKIGEDGQQPLLVKQVAQAENADGNPRVYYVEYDDLELTACQWHPNQADHARMARALIEEIEKIKPFR